MDYSSKDGVRDSREGVGVKKLPAAVMWMQLHSGARRSTYAFFLADLTSEEGALSKTKSPESSSDKDAAEAA
jgi:hypothetical protein